MAAAWQVSRTEAALYHLAIRPGCIGTGGPSLPRRHTPFHSPLPRFITQCSTRHREARHHVHYTAAVCLLTAELASRTRFACIERRQRYRRSAPTARWTVVPNLFRDFWYRAGDVSSTTPTFLCLLRLDIADIMEASAWRSNRDKLEFYQCWLSFFLLSFFRKIHFVFWRMEELTRWFFSFSFPR